MPQLFDELIVEMLEDLKNPPAPPPPSLDLALAERRFSATFPLPPLPHLFGRRTAKLHVRLVRRNAALAGISYSSCPPASHPECFRDTLKECLKTIEGNAAKLLRQLESHPGRSRTSSSATAPYTENITENGEESATEDGGENAAADTHEKENTAADTHEGENSAADTHGEENSAADTHEGENAAADTLGEENAAADTHEGENAAADTHGEENAPADTHEGENTAADTHDEEDAASDTHEGENAAADAHGGENAAADTHEGHNTAADTQGGDSPAIHAENINGVDEEDLEEAAACVAEEQVEEDEIPQEEEIVRGGEMLNNGNDINLNAARPVQIPRGTHVDAIADLMEKIKIAFEEKMQKNTGEINAQELENYEKQKMIIAEIIYVCRTFNNRNIFYGGGLAAGSATSNGNSAHRGEEENEEHPPPGGKNGLLFVKDKMKYERLRTLVQQLYDSGEVPQKAALLLISILLLNNNNFSSNEVENGEEKEERNGNGTVCHHNGTSNRENKNKEVNKNNEKQEEKYNQIQQNGNSSAASHPATEEEEEQNEGEEGERLCTEREKQNVTKFLDDICRAAEEGAVELMEVLNMDILLGVAVGEISDTQVLQIMQRRARDR